MSRKAILTYGCPECKGGEHPVEVIMDETVLNTIICPHCGSKGKYQLRQWKGVERLDWVVSYSDDSALYYEVCDCEQCGGKFTLYITHLKYHDTSICRACLAQLSKEGRS